MLTMQKRRVTRSVLLIITIFAAILVASGAKTTLAAQAFNKDTQLRLTINGTYALFGTKSDPGMVFAVCERYNDLTVKAFSGFDESGDPIPVPGGPQYQFDSEDAWFAEFQKEEPNFYGLYGYKNGRQSIFPARALAAVFGCSVEYDAASKTITLTKGAQSVKCVMDQEIAMLDGQEFTLNAKPQLIDGVAYLPTHSMAKIFGAESYDVNHSFRSYSSDETHISTCRKSTIKKSDDFLKKLYADIEGLKANHAITKVEIETSSYRSDDAYSKFQGMKDFEVTLYMAPHPEYYGRIIKDGYGYTVGEMPEHAYALSVYGDIQGDVYKNISIHASTPMNFLAPPRREALDLFVDVCEIICPGSKQSAAAYVQKAYEDTIAPGTNLIRLEKKYEDPESALWINDDFQITVLPDFDGSASGYPLGTDIATNLDVPPLDYLGWFSADAALKQQEWKYFFYPDGEDMTVFSRSE